MRLKHCPLYIFLLHYVNRAALYDQPCVYSYPLWASTLLFIVEKTSILFFSGEQANISFINHESIVCIKRIYVEKSAKRFNFFTDGLLEILPN